MLNLLFQAIEGSNVFSIGKTVGAQLSCFGLFRTDVLCFSIMFKKACKGDDPSSNVQELG